MSSAWSASRSAEMVTTIAIQGAGSIAMFATIAVIARSMGPAVQGIFSIAKAEVDFLAAIFLLGMPQALFYFLRSERKLLDDSLALVAVHVVLAIPVIAVFRVLSPDVLSGSSESFAALVLSVGAAVLCVAYSDLRGIMLATHSSVVFSLVSVAPNVLILAFVGVITLKVGPADQLVGMPLFFASYALTLALVLLAFVRRTRRVSFQGWRKYCEPEGVASVWAVNVVSCSASDCRRAVRAASIVGPGSGRDVGWCICFSNDALRCCNYSAVPSNSASFQVVDSPRCV